MNRRSLKDLMHWLRAKADRHREDVIAIQDKQKAGTIDQPRANRILKKKRRKYRDYSKWASAIHEVIDRGDRAQTILRDLAPTRGGAYVLSRSQRGYILGDVGQGDPE